MIAVFVYGTLLVGESNHYVVSPFYMCNLERLTDVYLM